MTNTNAPSVCTVKQPAPRPSTYTSKETRRGWQHPDAVEVNAKNQQDCTDYRCPHCGYHWRQEWYS